MSHQVAKPPTPVQNILSGSLQNGGRKTSYPDMKLFTQVQKLFGGTD
jgi:hypothetical protein